MILIRPLYARVLRTAIGALIAITAVLSYSTSAHAAVWSVRDAPTADSCSGYIPFSGYITFARYQNPKCYRQGTLSSSDPNLGNDTWYDGTSMSSRVASNIMQTVGSQESVTIWRSQGCTGTKVTVTSSWLTALYYPSFKRNSSTNGC